MFKPVTFSNNFQVYSFGFNAVKNFSPDASGDIAAALASEGEKLDFSILKNRLENWLTRTLGKSAFTDADFVELRDNYSKNFGVKSYKRAYPGKDGCCQLWPHKRFCFSSGWPRQIGGFIRLNLAGIIMTYADSFISSSALTNTPAITRDGIRDYFSR